MKKLKKKIKDSIYLLNYPYGLDKKWDDECDRRFFKFLDCVTLALYFIIFAYPVASILTILVQNYG